jgi:putative transposase
VTVDAARRYRLYPTPVQAVRLTEWGHTCRTVYNLGLEQRDMCRNWRLRGRPTKARQCRSLTEARAELSWVQDLPAQSAQQVLANLQTGFERWWNGLGDRPTRHKRNGRLSVPFPGQAVQVRRLNRRWGAVRLPKIGDVQFRWTRTLGQVRNATVTFRAGQWHVSFAIDTNRKPVEPNGKPGVGVDFGVKCSAFASDETTPRLMSPSLTPGEQRRLVGLERRKARQVTWAKRYNGGKYSKRLLRTIAEIAKLKARQTRRRQDFTHKLTTDLTKNHGWVGIENLNVKGMTRSAKGTAEVPGRNVPQKAGLNRSILDNTPGERRRQLTYKAAWYGSEVWAVPAPYTSQTCNACSVVDRESREGCGREFACTACGHVEHADLNAARNIEGRARRMGGTLNSMRSTRKGASHRVTGRRLRVPLARSTT